MIKAANILIKTYPKKLATFFGSIIYEEKEYKGKYYSS